MNMSKTIGVFSILLILSSLVSAANVTLNETRDKICEILEVFYDLLVYIASGLAALMIVIMGVTWVVSADNSKARTDAKNAVVHVIIGLIIISIAIALVEIALPAGSDCISTWA